MPPVGMPPIVGGDLAAVLADGVYVGGGVLVVVLIVLLVLLLLRRP